MVFTKKKLHPCAGIEPISEESDLDTSACCLTSMAKMAEKHEKLCVKISPKCFKSVYLLPLQQFLKVF